MNLKNSPSAAEDQQNRIDVIAEAADEIIDCNDILGMFIDMMADVLAPTEKSKEIARAYALIQSIRLQLKSSEELVNLIRNEVDILNMKGGA